MATPPTKQQFEASSSSSATKRKDAADVVPVIDHERPEEVAAVAARVTPWPPRASEATGTEELTLSAMTEPVASTYMPSLEPDNSNDLSPLPPLQSGFYSYLLRKDYRPSTSTPASQHSTTCSPGSEGRTPSKYSGAAGSSYSGLSPLWSSSQNLIARDKNNALPPPRPVFSASSTTDVSRRVLILVVLVIACAMLILAMYGVVRFFKPRRAISAALEGPLCSTQHCQEFVRVLEYMLNTSIDPCTDMKAHTCTALPSDIVSHKYGTKLMTLGVTSQATYFGNLLSWAERRLSLAKHAASMYKVCMADVTDSEFAEGIRQLRTFMSQLNIPWPTAPAPGLDALGVLLDLAFNWRVELWFGVNVARHLDGSKNIILSSGSLLRVWLNIHKEVEASDAHREQWEAFFSMFAQGEAVLPPNDFNAVLPVNGHIFNELSGILKVRLPKPIQFVVRDAQSYTRSIPAHRWTKALNDNVKLYGPFLSSDSVTCTNAVLLEALDRIFTQQSSGKILKHLSWIFVLIYGPIADRSLLSVTYGSTEQARSLRPIFCAEQVTAAYPRLIESLHVLRYFNSSTRAATDLQLASIKKAALGKVAGLSWADKVFRKEISHKLERLTARIWPPESLLTERGLSKLHAGWFPASANQSFTESWLSAAFQRHQLLRDNASFRAALEKEPRLFTLPFVRYDYFLNEVLISAAALSSPQYFFGTRAMGYGALGLIYATQLAKVFDSVGLRVDADGRLRPNDSWVAASTKKALTTRDECVGSAFESAIPEVPALEIAHAAFEASFGADSSARSMRVVSGLNEEQLFFVVACVSMCSNRETLPSIRLDCNKAVMNFAPFARAFNCPPDSTMNPTRKCPYLD